MLLSPPPPSRNTAIALGCALVPHPEIKNTSGYAFQELHLADETGRPVLVLIVRGLWWWSGRVLEPVDGPPPIPLAGDLHPPLRPDLLPSARIEPELAFIKPAADVLLLGTARPSTRGAAQGSVRLRLGPIDKGVVVFGERRWSKGLLQPTLGEPSPFEGVALRWEHAFGGPEERRNPLGMGHFSKSSGFVPETPAPSLELPDQLIRRWKDAPTPAGFGVVGAGWVPRIQYAGTYDEAWKKTRMPALPADFDRRMFQCAPSDQVATLRGDEVFVVEGAGPSIGARFTAKLPGGQPPSAKVRLRDRDDAPAMMLDTVVIDADAMTVALTWRGHVVLGRGAHDVEAISIGQGRLA